MIKSDAIKNRVLHELIRVVRVSNAELAEREGPSASACLLRLEAADLPAYKTFHPEVLGTVPQVNSITAYVVMGSSRASEADNHGQ